MTPTNKFEFKVINKVDDDETTGELELYGEVLPHRPTGWFGEDLDYSCISPEGFLEAIETLKDKQTINVRLNTVGGDTDIGLMIYSVLRKTGAKIHVFVDGLAASAGSVIACAGDIVTMYPGSIIMIHESKCYVEGFCDTALLKKIERQTEAWNTSAAKIYASKTGLSEEKCRNMMNKETWLVGQQAVDEGFATEVTEGETKLRLVASAGKKMIVNEKGIGVIMEKDFLPERVQKVIATLSYSDNPPADDSSEDGTDDSTAITKKETDNKNIGGENMDISNVEELKKQFPDLCAQMVASADNSETVMQAERKRIQSIDSIAFMISDKALIEKAKFETGETAESLLMKNAMAEKQRRETELANIEKDAAQSKASNVQSSAANPLEELNKKDKPQEAKREEVFNKIDSVLGGVK